MALKYLPYWPDPNQAGTEDGRQNYFRTRDINRDNRTLVGRLDHNLSENHRMSFRLNNQQHDNRTNTLPTLATGDITDRTAWGAVLDAVHVFNPQLLLNLRYEYESPTSERFNRCIRGFDFSTPNPVAAAALASYAKAPIPAVPVSSFRTVGGLLFVGLGGQPRGMWSADRNNLAPRIGLAYRLTRRTVLKNSLPAPRADKLKTVLKKSCTD